MTQKKNTSSRRTQIICTIGPSCWTEEKIEALIRAGMDIARINCSHVNHTQIIAIVALIRSTAKRLGRIVMILLDLQGPKIRVGSLLEPIMLKGASEVTITTRSSIAGTIPTSYELLPQDVQIGDHILLDDGLIKLRVLHKTETDIRCEVIHGGPLGSHKGMNLPDGTVSAPALTPEDLDNLRIGLEQCVDYVGLSFVREPGDVEKALMLISDYQASSGSCVPTLVTKIETRQAIDQLDKILSVSQAVMVARGDLGGEVGLPKVPRLQKIIVAKCNRLELFTIVATQMLESMITNPCPTRAEISDIFNAVLDLSWSRSSLPYSSARNGAVMLSAETASGKYPVEAVEIMASTIEEAEASLRGATWDLIGSSL